jgi:hypothetical protein
MRKVEILKPVASHAVGETPTLPGHEVRALLASGHAKLADNKAKKPAKAKV